MINALILMNLIFFSFEIKRCDEVVPVCQKCITGYKILIYKKVDKRVCKQEDSFNIGIEHCTYLDYTDESKCQECEMGYAVTKDGKECKANSEHCDVLDGDTCIKCEHYFKLINDKKCEKSTCYSFDEDNNCVCIDGFYKNNKNTCSRIPIKHCYKGNSTYCESCGGGYKYDIGKNECIITEEVFEPIEDTTKINIDHCLELEKTITQCVEIVIIIMSGIVLQKLVNLYLLVELKNYVMNALIITIPMIMEKLAKKWI